MDPHNKKKLRLSPALCNPTEKEEGEGEGEGGRTWSEASQATASHLREGASPAFRQGVACLQARRRRVASRRPEPRRAFHNYGIQIKSLGFFSYFRTS